MEKILAEIWSTPSLEKAGFVVAPGSVNTLLMRAADGEISSENEFADTYGQLNTNLLADRFERGLWLLRGIPWWFLLALKSDNDMKYVFKDLCATVAWLVSSCL